MRGRAAQQRLLCFGLLAVAHHVVLAWNGRFQLDSSSLQPRDAHEVTGPPAHWSIDHRGGGGGGGGSQSGVPAAQQEEAGARSGVIARDLQPAAAAAAAAFTGLELALLVVAVALATLVLALVMIDCTTRWYSSWHARRADARASARARARHRRRRLAAEGITTGDRDISDSIDGEYDDSDGGEVSSGSESNVRAQRRYADKIRSLVVSSICRNNNNDLLKGLRGLGRVPGASMCSDMFRSGRQKQPLLLLAVERRCGIPLIRTLISAGCDPHSCDRDGTTAMHVAAAQGQFEVLALLADEAGAYAKIRNVWNQTPFDIALAQGHDIIADRIFQRFSGPSRPKQRYRFAESTLMRLIKTAPQRRILRHITSSRECVDRRRAGSNDTALHVAVRRGRIDIVDVLLRHGALLSTINNRGDTPVDVALAAGRRDILALLVHAGCHVHAYGVTPMAEVPLLHAARLAVGVALSLQQDLALDLAAAQAAARRPPDYAGQRASLWPVPVLTHKPSSPALLCYVEEASAEDLPSSTAQPMATRVGAEIGWTLPNTAAAMELDDEAILRRAGSSSELTVQMFGDAGPATPIKHVLQRQDSLYHNLDIEAMTVPATGVEEYAFQRSRSHDDDDALSLERLMARATATTEYPVQEATVAPRQEVEHAPRIEDIGFSSSVREHALLWSDTEVQARVTMPAPAPGIEEILPMKDRGDKAGGESVYDRHGPFQLSAEDMSAAAPSIADLATVESGSSGARPVRVGISGSNGESSSGSSGGDRGGSVQVINADRGAGVGFQYDVDEQDSGSGADWHKILPADPSSTSTSSSPAKVFVRYEYEPEGEEDVAYAVVVYDDEDA